MRGPVGDEKTSRRLGNATPNEETCQDEETQLPMTNPNPVMDNENPCSG
jgi:hypothetical protein